jgi:4-amino-4-deoxy-L-arabinose transferase-like glycosyltransferase/predicted XRE-type DNA-binding protein
MSLRAQGDAKGVGPDQLRLLAKIARMYHERGVRQPQIAADLGISQSRVSRMLRQASDLGIVRTMVMMPEGVHTDLEVTVGVAQSAEPTPVGSMTRPAEATGTDSVAQTSPVVGDSERDADVPEVDAVAHEGGDAVSPEGDYEAPASERRRWRVVHAVGALTLAGLAIRLLAGRGLWLDEAIAVSQARMGWGEMIAHLRFTDVHPPLHSAILWVSVRLLGTSELAVRSPSVVAGALLIPVLYLMARDLYGRRTAMVAASLATVAPFLIWYSQEARMYSLFMLFGTLAVWAQARILREPRWGGWVGYGLATTLLLWTHYFAVLQVLVQQVFFAVAAWRRWRSGQGAGFLMAWVGVGVCVALALVPLAPILQDQLVAYTNRGALFQEVPARAGGMLDPGQNQLTIYALLANLVWAMWGYHSDFVMTRIVALWPLGMLFMLFLLGRRRSLASGLAVAAIGGPLVLLFLAGLVKRDLFELRYFAVAAPLLVLLVSRVVTAGFVRARMQAVAAALVMVTLLAGAVDQQVNGANPRRYDFRSALADVSSLARPDDVVLYAPFYLEPVMDYYSPELGARSLSRDVPMPGPGRVIVVGSFLDDRNVSAAIGEALGQLDFNSELEREIEHARVKVWVFR